MSEQKAVGSPGEFSAASPVLPVRAIAFDLDGTLLDTIHDLAGAVNALLEELGHPVLPKAEIRDMVGKGMATLVRRALARATGVSPAAVEDAEVASALAAYQRHYAERLGRETKAFPGLKETLTRLQAMGFPLAIVTNKATRFVRPHLERAGIAGFFAQVVGGDDLPAKKPDPAPLLHVAAGFGIAPEQLLMVGDSGNDVAAARAAGCPVLVLPYGYSEGTPVQDLGADGIVLSLLAIPDRVRLPASAA